MKSPIETISSTFAFLKGTLIEDTPLSENQNLVEGRLPKFVTTGVRIIEGNNKRVEQLERLLEGSEVNQMNVRVEDWDLVRKLMPRTCALQPASKSSSEDSLFHFNGPKSIENSQRELKLQSKGIHQTINARIVAEEAKKVDTPVWDSFKATLVIYNLEGKMVKSWEKYANPPPKEIVEGANVQLGVLFEPNTTITYIVERKPPKKDAALPSDATVPSEEPQDTPKVTKRLKISETEATAVPSEEPQDTPTQPVSGETMILSDTTKPKKESIKETISFTLPKNLDVVVLCEAGVRQLLEGNKELYNFLHNEMGVIKSEVPAPTNMFHITTNSQGMNKRKLEDEMNEN